MKRPLLFFTLLFVVNALCAQTSSWKWARNGLGDAYDEAYNVTTDLNGNVIAVGYFASDSIVFGNVTLYNFSPGNDDAFIVKYDSSGNFIWARGIGGTGDDKSYSVATDASGNVFVAGNFYSPVITIGSYTFTNAGNVGDIFIVKYDAAGTLLWATKEGGPGLEVPHAIIIDGSNNMIIGGQFASQSITFGTTTLNLVGSIDAFVVKYNSSGGVVWAKSAGSGGNDMTYSIAADINEDIIATGTFTGNATFGSITLSTNGSGDIFLAKFDAGTGAVLWASKTGGNTQDEGRCVRLDVYNNIYLSGFFQSDVMTVGSVTLNNFFTAGNNNGFIAKYNSNGNGIWAHAINGQSKVTGLALSGTHVYGCGSFNHDSLNYGGYTLFQNGSSDFFITHCDTSGNSRWAMYQTAGGGSSENANKIDADAWGNVVVAGFIKSDPVTFGTTTLNSGGNFDMFVARMGGSPTGITSLENTNHFVIYPNPTDGPINIEMSHTSYKAEIYNSTGQKVYSFFNSANAAHKVNLNWLPSGIYMVKVYDRGEVYSQKMVKL